mmetsp:Transcript_36202/g.81353  ORF Transcript_36202/g.81353 Transcript_36202/m.81353 type:complete len:288 (+) Transcript_36202:2338-3201(+)
MPNPPNPAPAAEDAVVSACSSYTGRRSYRSQTKVWLSLPQLRRSEVSEGHQLMLSTPWVCPWSWASGSVVDDRRSHMLITGLVSSPMAVTIWRPSMGFQAMSAMAPFFASRSSHQDFFCRRSHTWQLPLAEAEARMCGTRVFHATRETSAVCLAAPGSGAGTYGCLGVSGRSRLWMRTWPSAPPDASRWFDAAIGLKSSPATGPPWCLKELICGLGCLEMSLDGSQRLIVPSFIPPAMSPDPKSELKLLIGDQAIDENFPVVLTDPATEHLRPRSWKSSLWISSSPP